MSDATLEQAQDLDARDPLAGYRERFWIPPSPADPARESIYLCGNSLGLQPKTTRPALMQELDDWQRLGVEGHFEAQTPWYSYHEVVREPAARLVGAFPDEVVVMNSLTVNLHLLMLSFYRPTPTRPKLVIDAPCFPSDVYAVKSQLRLHGYDPEEHLIWLRPREGEHCLRTEDVEATLAAEGAQVALALITGVNYLTGQRMDLERIARAAHAQGATLGVDLAHATGNVPLRLHDWGVDFAAWCSYKYLNAGPGSLGGAFVHRKHLGQEGAEAFAAFRAQPRCEGWWGNDPASRFAMEGEFVPVPRADAWQLSNPPIFALTPVKTSLELFDEVGIPALRAKSVALTGYLERLIDAIPGEVFEVVTPRDPEQRGCQLSILVHERPEELFRALQAAGVICDFRRPNVIRVAPAPLYNGYVDCWRFAQVLRDAAAAHG
ncbi:MAG: kynureninase [Planctomycetota bacterium]